MKVLYVVFCDGRPIAYYLSLRSAERHLSDRAKEFGYTKHDTPYHIEQRTVSP